MDVVYLRQRGVTLACTPGDSTISVAEGALALLLAINVGLIPAGTAAEAGTPLPPPRRTTVCGSTLGIVGMGHIGQRVARLAFALGIRIRYYSRTRHWDIEDELTATFCDPPTLFGSCASPAG